MHNYKFKTLDKVEPSHIIKKIWFFKLITFLILVVILFLPWQQTIKGEGTVIALDPTQRDYQIVSTIDGFIDEFHVSENQFVTKGTKLFTIIDLDRDYSDKLKSIEDSSRDKYKNTKLQIINYKQKQDNLQEYLLVGMWVYNQKYEQILRKIKNLEFNKTFLEKKYEIDKSNFDRIKLLYKDGIESKRNLELKENEYVKAEVELKKVDVDLEIQNQNLDILDNERKQFVKETENKIKSLNNKTLASENLLRTFMQDIEKNSIDVSRYKSREVVAQKDGYVTRILQNDKNKFIKKGEKVIHFSPVVKKKAVLLKVSDFNMPLIKEELRTRIMFYGWPALNIPGWPKITFGTFGGVIKKVEQTSYEKGFYYAQIVEDPKDQPWPDGDSIRVGTQSTVWVRLSTVPIWYQLWRLMNAQPPKMVTPASETKR